MIDSIRNFLQRRKEKSLESKRKFAEKQAKVMFNLTTHEKELWLTCNGTLVCPTTMLVADEITALYAIRDLYVKNHVDI